jgi:hypothetical protein
MSLKCFLLLGPIIMAFCQEAWSGVMRGRFCPLGGYHYHTPGFLWRGGGSMMDVDLLGRECVG